MVDTSGMRLSSIVLSLAIASGAWAQAPHDHQPTKPADGPAPVAKDAMTEGEVRKVDREQGWVTLKHGEIRNVGMPAMTMVFRTSDKALLDPIREGDKVRFVVDDQMTVTKIEVAP